MKPRVRPPKRPGQAPFRVNADDPGPEPDFDLDMRRPDAGKNRATWAGLIIALLALAAGVVAVWNAP